MIKFFESELPVATEKNIVVKSYAVKHDINFALVFVFQG